MILLRLYLLSGLIVHKLLWEVLKRGNRNAPAPRSGTVPLQLRLVKAVKVSILLGLAVQTVLPTVLPLAEEPALVVTIGLALYSLGLLTAIASRVALADNWSDIEDARMLGNQKVVSRGLYRYVRHPIYVGDLLLLLGFELSLNSWLVLGVVLLIPVVLMKAIQEERTLMNSLPGYALYCARTKRFIPFVV